MYKFIVCLSAIMVLSACGQPGAEYATPPKIITPADAIIPADTPQSPADAAKKISTIPERPTEINAKLTLMSHDSFNISQTVINEFQQAHNATLEILKSGDTGAALNKAILSRNSPLADLFFGIDNTFLSRALAADIFEPYASPQRENIPADLQLDQSYRLLPVDYSYITINYDKAALEAAGLQPPQALRTLTQAEWKGKLVVENPATSSPGLAFVLATIGHFGDSGDYTWRDFWRDLRANEVYVSEGWEDAYYMQFSGSSAEGLRPLVVSYATSPAAEVFFSEGKLTKPPTGNLSAPGGSFRQIEFVGILKGTQQRALAETFVDFMLQPTFQADIPLHMFVYPANQEAPIPELFQQFAEIPNAPITISPEQIDQNREEWIEEWTKIVLR